MGDFLTGQGRQGKKISEFADISKLGSQGVVSEILSGKRGLNVKQVSRLAKRFNVSPSVFLESGGLTAETLSVGSPTGALVGELLLASSPSPAPSPRH